MSSIKNRDRQSLFSLLQIDIDKYRGRWRIFVGEKRVGKTYQRKSQAIQAARLIRRAYIESGTCLQVEGMLHEALGGQSTEPKQITWADIQEKLLHDALSSDPSKPNA